MRSKGEPAIRGTRCKYTHSFRGLVHEICEQLGDHVEPMQVARWLKASRSRPNRHMPRWHFHRRSLWNGPATLADEDLYLRGVVEWSQCCERCGDNLSSWDSQYDTFCVAYDDGDSRYAWTPEWAERQIQPTETEREEFRLDDGTIRTLIRHRRRRFYADWWTFLRAAKAKFGTPCIACGQLGYGNDVWRRFPWSHSLGYIEICEACSRDVEKVDRREAKRMFGTLWEAEHFRHQDHTWDRNMANLVLAAWAVEVAKKVLREERERRKHERETDTAANG